MDATRLTWVLLFLPLIVGCPTRTVYDADGGAGGGLGGANGGAAGKNGVGGKAGSAGTAGIGAAGTGSAGATAGNGAGGGSGAAGGAAGLGGAHAGGGGGSGGIPGTGGSSGAGGTSPTGCSQTQHLCAGVCSDNKSVQTCGSRCDACVAPAGGTPSCDGTTCDFTCGGSTPKKCQAAGICVGSTGCCGNTDCPTNAGGQTGTCDTTTHACNYACSGSTKSCTVGSTTTCIPMTACCNNSDCTGSCVKCDTSTHACVPAKGMDDPNGRCAGTCDSSGACKSKQGQTCNTVAGGCVSGTTCSPDGVCCDTACTGSCVACDLAGHLGTCTNLAAASSPHTGHPSCAGSGTPCAGTCGGGGVCSYPTASCGTASCSADKFVDKGTCSAGTCVPPSPTSCAGGFVCSGSACRTSCVSDADCEPDHYCEAGVCEPDATQVICGSEHSCALLVDGTVRCWGRNQFGQLGSSGPAVSTSAPVAVTGFGGTVKSISGHGADHNCALLSSGAVQCWGSDSSGQLGSSVSSVNQSSPTPLTVPGLPGTATAITASPDFSCALISSTGAVWCWGINIWGNLGRGTSGSTGGQPPGPVSGLTGVSSISGGEDVMCAVSGGLTYCWGDDDSGQVGSATMPTDGAVSTPQVVIGVGNGGSPTTAVATMGFHGCAIVSGGSVSCWGWNIDGTLGSTAVADGAQSTSAVAVQGLPSGAKAITAGVYHSCVLLTNGTVWCWGNETYGQLGNGVLMQEAFSVKPVQVTGLPAGLQATSVAAGFDHTCVVMSNGSVWCWGRGDFGELGNGTATSSTPVQVTGW